MCLVERLTVVEEALESTFTGTPIADIGERLDRITASVGINYRITRAESISGCNCKR